MPLTSCPDQSLLHRYVTGELASAELADAEEHFHACVSCAAGLRNLGVLRPSPAITSGDGTEQQQRLYFPYFPEIPGYEVLSELGRGAMGIVYLARQVGLDRLVALKVMLAGAHASPEDMARFRCEAEAVSRLQHLNIVQVYQVGEWRPTQTGASLPFFSLEYVAGGTLARRINATPQPAQESAGLVEVLARAIGAAHQRGIVHRDLKPANVLLQDGQQVPAGAADPAPMDLQWAIPKIADFGLAKKLDAAVGHTRSGAIMGTPSYMAPEQAAGRIKEIGPLADVYALGAILYEMLTGRPPFRGETAIDTVWQVLSDEPVPPSRLNPKAPRDLETICLKCLQKEARARYSSALTLADDLHRFCVGEPICARPVSRRERIWKWMQRKPAIAGLLAGMLLLVLLGSGIVWALAAVAEEQALAALHQSKRANETAGVMVERAEAALAAAMAELATAKEFNPEQLAAVKSLVETRKGQVKIQQVLFKRVTDEFIEGGRSYEKWLRASTELEQAEAQQYLAQSEAERLELECPSWQRKEALAKIALAKARLDLARLAANEPTGTDTQGILTSLQLAEAQALVRLAEIRTEKVKRLAAEREIEMRRIKALIGFSEKEAAKVQIVDTQARFLVKLGDPKIKITTFNLSQLHSLKLRLQAEALSHKIALTKLAGQDFAEEKRQARLELAAAQERMNQLLSQANAK